MGQQARMPSPITTFDYATLANRAAIQTAGAPEAVVDVLYDTLTYPAAGIVRLDFFANAPANGDVTLSNMGQPGGLEAQNFFDVWRIGVDFLRVPTVTTTLTAAGLLNDVATLLHTARATLTFNYQGKPLGPIPLGLFGSLSAPVGVIGGTSAPAAGAAAIIQFAQNADNGGWPVNGSIKLKPNTKFGIRLDFATASAVSADTPIRVTLLGIRYRPLA